MSENQIDPYSLLITHPASTFFMKASADISHLGIFHDDILVVDMEAEAFNGKIVVADFNDELRFALIAM